MDQPGMNESGWLPVRFDVIVEPKAVEAQTKGGLLLPEKVKEKDEFGRTEGTLVAISPLAFSYANWPEGSRKPVVGDIVIFSRYSANELMGEDGKSYWMMKDDAIAAVKA